MRSRTIAGVAVGLCLFLSSPGFGAQSFSLAYDGWQDSDGDGLIDCLEVVNFRVSLLGTGALPGGDSGTITVPSIPPVHWDYFAGTFQLDPASEGCAFAIVSGNTPGDTALVLNYTCDPRAANPLDDTYALIFRVSGVYPFGSAGGITVDALNQRTSPTSGTQQARASSTTLTDPCIAPSDLHLTKSVASGNGAAGATLVYTLTLSNFGGSAAADVVLQETVPNHTTFSPGDSSPGWTCSPNNSAGSSCTLALGTVPAGASLTRSFGVIVDSSLPVNPGNIDNTACVTTSSPGDPVENNCGTTSTPAGNPDLRTTKSVASGSGDPGATLVYSLSLSNIGSLDAAGVQVTDTVPALATFLPASSSPGWSCSPNNNAGSTCVLAIGTVAAGTSVSRTFAVQLAATFPASPPSIDNTACSSTSTPGDPAADNCGSVSTPPGGNPDMRTTKSVVSGNGDPGGTLVYDLVISNLGNRDAAGVQVTDTVPALATFLPASSSPGWSCTPNNAAGSTCVLALGALAAGTSTNRTFAVQLAATFPSNPPAIDNTACSSSVAPGDPAGNDCGSVSTPPGGNPDVRTVKRVVSGTGDPGSSLVYDLEVTNIGTRDADGIELTETVPALATFLPASSSPGWICTPDNTAGSTCRLTIGSMAAGSTTNRTFAVQLAATFPADPPPIDNTACSSTSSPGDPAGNDCDSVSTRPGGNPDLRTEKSVASGTGDPGATLVFSLVVSNIGNRDASGVQITETVPALATFLPGSSSPGWSCSPSDSAGSTCILGVGTVVAGDSVVRTFAVQLASTFPSDPPSIDNTACSSSPASGDPAGNDCGSTSTPPGGNPDLVVSKSVSSGTGDPGSVLVYELVLSNAGTRDAAGVTLQETVPQLTSFLPAASSPGWACTPDGNAGSACMLSVGTVGAGSSAIFTFAVQVIESFPPNPPMIDNSACASTASGGDPAGNDCDITSTPPGGNPDVQLSKSVASGTGDPGSVLVYELVLSNAGTRDAAGVTLQETVPQLTSFLPAASSPGWACTPDGNAGSACTLSVGTVGAGSSATFTFAVQVIASFPPNPPMIDNAACASTASGGDPAGNDCDSTSTPPGGNPDVRLSKSVVSGTGDPGSVLVYELVVSNAGTRDAASVVLQETVPQLSSFLAAASSPGWTCTPDGNAGSACTLSVGTVGAGSSATFTFAVQLADVFPPNPPAIDNTACASTPTGGNPAGNECGSTSTPPGGQADLVLTKALTSGTVVPDGVLVFTLSLRNQGNRAATGVVLRETVPADSTFEAASSSPGWSCTPDGSAGSTCTLQVGSVPAGGSSSHVFAVRLRSDLPAGTRVTNTACAEQEPGANDPAGNNCPTVIIDPPGPDTRTDVEVTLGVDEPQRRPGDPFVFTLTVRNVSAVLAEGLRISVSLPSFGTEPTELDPACQNPGGVAIECSLAQLAGGATASFTWKQAAFQTGEYTVVAELMEAAPEDVDSTPGNGIRTEDDFAELRVVVSVGEIVHEIPTLSEVGISVMVVLLLALGVVLMRRGGARRAA